MEVYTIQQARKAEFTLEPLLCPHCNNVGEITFNQAANRFYCAFCGMWAKENDDS